MTNTWKTAMDKRRRGTIQQNDQQLIPIRTSYQSVESDKNWWITMKKKILVPEMEADRKTSPM